MALKRRLLCSASLAAMIVFAPRAAPQIDPAPPQSGTADNTLDQQAQDDVVVTGVRASLIEGLQNKREATQIIESVVAEGVGKLPDDNFGSSILGRTFALGLRYSFD